MLHCAALLVSNWVDTSLQQHCLQSYSLNVHMKIGRVERITRALHIIKQPMSKFLSSPDLLSYSCLGQQYGMKRTKLIWLFPSIIKFWEIAMCLPITFDTARTTRPDIAIKCTLQLKIHGMIFFFIRKWGPHYSNLWLIDACQWRRQSSLVSATKPNDRLEYPYRTLRLWLGRLRIRAVICVGMEKIGIGACHSTQPLPSDVIFVQKPF